MDSHSGHYLAICFGTDHSGSRPCELALTHRGLEIGSQGQILEAWPLDKLNLASTGDEQSYLLISTPNPAVVGSVVVKDPRFRADLIPLVTGQAREFLLGFDTRKKQVQRRLWLNLILFCVVGLAALVGGYYGLTQGIAAWTAKTMPVSTEVKWGGYIAQTFVASEKVLTQGSAVNACQQILDRLTNALGPSNSYTFTLHVVDRADVNALALPGGHIVVFTGLLKEADHAEEVAGVMAHEIQHILQRHVVKRIVTQLGARVLLLSFFGGTDLSSIALGAGQLLSLSYGRDQEREADREGLLLLQQARIRTDGLAAFFEKLEKKQTLQIPEILSTHPAHQDRIKALQETITQRPAQPPLPLDIDWAEVRRSL